MTVERTKPKQLLRPITAGANSAMNQSQFLAITCNSLEAREKSRVHGAIGFGFASHWLKNWRESFKPSTRRSNRNHVITFDSHLKTALTVFNIDVVALNCKLKRNLKRLISGLIIDPHNYQLPVGLIAELTLKHCTGIAEVRVRVPFGPEFISPFLLRLN